MTKGIQFIKLLLLTSFTFSHAQQLDDIDENGILHVNDAWGLRPGGSVMAVTSAKYPEPAPGNMLQTWRAVTFPGSAIRLTCYSITLPKLSTGACGEYLFHFQDGEEEKDFCGDIGYMSILSVTNEINMFLKTGPSSSGTVNCTVQGRAMGPYGEVTEPPTTTTTAPPPPTRPPYLTLESEEVDSSEFGGPKGEKSTTCSCGWANKENTRIIGGEETKAFEFPFMVGLANLNSYSPFCGGSIISPYHVLTAAHCVFGTEEMQVFIGKHDYTSDTNISQAIKVKKIIIHDKYSQKRPNYDIALLLLEKKIEYSQHIGPVCIPSKQLNLDMQYLTTIGWGMIAPVGPTSPVLKKVHVRVVPLSKCAEILPHQVSLSEPHQLCTFSKLKGFGRGDSGGPVVWLNPETNRYTLVGLPSFVFLYEKNQYLPDVAADVSSFVHWIVDRIRETNTGGYPCWALD